MSSLSAQSASEGGLAFAQWEMVEGFWAEGQQVQSDAVEILNTDCMLVIIGFIFSTWYSAWHIIGSG